MDERNRTVNTTPRTQNMKEMYKHYWDLTQATIEQKKKNQSVLLNHHNQYVLSVSKRIDSNYLSLFCCYFFMLKSFGWEPPHMCRRNFCFVAFHLTWNFSLWAHSFLFIMMVLVNFFHIEIIWHWTSAPIEDNDKIVTVNEYVRIHVFYVYAVPYMKRPTKASKYEGKAKRKCQWMKRSGPKRKQKNKKTSIELKK